MGIKNVRNAFILDANTMLHSRHATRFSYAGSIVTQPYRTAALTSLFPLSFKPSEAQKNIEPCPRHTASVNKPARPCEQPSPKWGKARGAAERRGGLGRGGERETENAAAWQKGGGWGVFLRA